MARYDPSVFEAADLPAARAIILTDEGETTTEHRWATETPWLLDRVGAALHGSATGLLLDFGCGVGRVSGGLLERHPGLKILGLDAAAAMRAHARQQLGDERFTALSPGQFDALAAAGLRCDAAVAVWVLQHCADPAAEIARIHAGLRRGAIFVVLDMHHRAVPTDAGWVDDGLRIADLVGQRFHLVRTERFDAPDAPARLRESAWLGVYLRT